MQLSRAAVCAAIVLSASIICVAASAQTSNTTSFTAERFEPMPAQGINYLNLATSDVVPHDQPTAGLFLHFVGDPLVQRDEDGEIIRRLVDDQLKAEIWAGVGIHDLVDLGFVLPTVLTQSSDELELFGDPNETIRSTVLGDLRVVPKVRVLDPEMAYGIGVGFVPTIILPTGDRGSFNSDGTLRFEPKLAIDWRHEDGYHVVGNVAYSFRPERPAESYVSDDSFRWAFGGYTPIPLPTLEGLGVIATLFGDAPLSGDLERDGFNAPVEFDAAVQYQLPLQMVAQLGAGTGLTDGVGAPSYRIFASFGYTPKVKDSDGDGLYDNEDDCPQDPEDYDNFEDGDGCPDHDNDQDGILDVDDDCPDDPEDIDGFEDDDGCPDPDNDKDTVLDVDDECPDTPGPPERNGCPEGDRDGDGIGDDTDACPDDPEDKDGFEDEDGCPDLDNDNDGILDADDKCPNDPEDIDTFEDADGCPDPDNDQDTILDVDDDCPLQPENMNGKEDDDGCPEDSKVRITKIKIEILEKVFFDTAKATIKKRSFPLLDEVAQVLNQNPQLSKIRIEGHTDSRGSDKYNQKLSDERAASVMQYLLNKGVDTSRLVSKGYGEANPIADNDTKAGRSQNRRVEFVILEVDGKSTETKETTIETKETVIESNKDDAKNDDAKKDDAKKDDAKKDDAKKDDAKKDDAKKDDTEKDDTEKDGPKIERQDADKKEETKTAPKTSEEVPAFD